MSDVTESGTGERGKWVWRDGRFVSIKEAPKRVTVPYIHKDEVDPFWNHATNQVETSMSTYRRHLKEAGYFEKGNDRMKYTLPSREERRAEIKKDVLEAKRQIEWGMAKSTNEERELWSKPQNERLEMMDRMKRDRERRAN